MPSPLAMRIGKIVAATTPVVQPFIGWVRARRRFPVGIRHVSGEGRSFQAQSNLAIGGEGAIATGYCAPFCPNLVTDCAY